MSRTRLIVVGLLGVVVNIVGAEAQSTRHPSGDANARVMNVRDLLEVRQAGDQWSGSNVQISPDGRWIVYQVREPLLEKNQYAFDLWLSKATRVSQPKQLTRLEPTDDFAVSLMPRWSPDSNRIVYLSTSSGEIRLIRTDDSPEETLIEVSACLHGVADLESGGVTGLDWSPDGNSVALVITATVEENETARRTRGIEADVDWHPRNPPESFGLLCMVNVESRQVTRLTDRSLNVQAFDWAPTGGRIAMTASEDRGWGAFMRTDLYVVNLAGDKVKTLLEQPGMETDPVWSPDGQWIAFRSQRGREDWVYTAWLALIPSSGGEPTYLTDEFLKGSGGNPRQIFWSADSQEIYFSADYDMSNQLFRIGLHDKKVSKVTPDNAQYYEHFSASGNTERLAFTAESVIAPRDVYVASRDFTQVKRLTHWNPELGGIAHPHVETITWRSNDDKWDIHGVLIKPPNFSKSERYPVLVVLYGGPSMVPREYGLYGQFPVEVFASRGYVILAPNTRGREGYGYSFAHAIGDERSYGLKPLEDALAGVDELVRRGIADPDRLGVMGHSYGGYLAALAITQTNRFKAASVSEAGITNLVAGMFLVAGREDPMKLHRIMWGLGSPHSPAEMALAVNQSPVHHLRNAKTPTLIEAGGEGARPERALPLFRGLQSLQVPSEFVVYPGMGHVWTEPRVREESFRRNLEWFDYWVLGEATKRMAERYGDHFGNAKTQ